MVGARLGSSSARLSLLSCLGFASLGACSDVPQEASARDPVAESKQAFSNFGIERVIPLRIVMMANDCTNPATEWSCENWWTPPAQNTCTPCTSGTNCGPDTADYADIRRGVEQANFALKALGVQIYISRIEKYKMPQFWNVKPISGQPTVTWAAVRDQLKLVFPALSLTEFDPNLKRHEPEWLHTAAIRFGEPREVIVWLAECSRGWDGARPWVGAASWIADRAQFQFPRAVAHEIGHILGLEHTMYPSQSSDPEVTWDGCCAPWTEYWDLEYGWQWQTGLPTNYFTTRAQAQSYFDRHSPKQTWDPGGQNQNCRLDANCTLKCCIGQGAVIDGSGNCVGGVAQSLGDPGIAGLGFTFAGDSPGGGVYRRGANAMMYLDDPPGGACQWSGFAESQAEQVKKVLRSDMRIDAPQYFAPLADGRTAKRNLLGDYRDRWGVDQLDFDGDGKRDIGVWQPPGTPGAPTPGVGRFRVLTSSSGYTALLERDFGRLGDVPVPGYYDADTKVDFAVLRRGGLTTENPFDSQLWWLWCKSAQNHDCTSYGQLDWGFQYDVPLPNVEFDGNASTREVAVYRPTDKFVHWKVAGGTTWGSISTGFASRVVHLHGLYDSDTKTDVVLYDPGQAQPGPSPGPRFQMLLSTQNWATAHVRSFNSALMADAVAASGAGSGATAVRHGGVAVPAESNGRRVLRVWDAYAGDFHTMWDPIGAPTTITTCQWGSPRDIPLGAPIDRNADGRTDLVVARPNGNANGPAVFVLAGSPCGTWSGFYPPDLTEKTRIWAVTDMNGDGKGDFLLLDPDTFAWRPWFSSGTTWVAAGTFYLGDVGAVPL